MATPLGYQDEITPESAALQRKLAMALLQQGSDASPVQHWTQGAARLAQALVGGMQMGSIDRREAEARKSENAAILAALGGGQQAAPQLPPMASPASPPMPAQPAPMPPPAAMPPQAPPLPSGPPVDPNKLPVANMTDPRVKELGVSVTDIPPGQPATAAAMPKLNPALLTAMEGRYASPGLKTLALAQLQRQLKPDEWTHFTAGDKNMVYNKTNPTQIMDLGAGSQNKFGNVAELRREIHQLTSYKNWAQAEPIYRTMVDAATRDTKAADLNLVYGLGKIFDPNSVVREGEMVLVKDTAALPDWLVGSINSINGGARLQPETRKAIMAEARSRAEQYRNLAVGDTAPYRGIAERNRINPDDIIPPIRDLPTVAPTSADAMAALKAELIKRGLMKQ